MSISLVYRKRLPIWAFLALITTWMPCLAQNNRAIDLVAQYSSATVFLAVRGIDSTTGDKVVNLGTGFIVSASGYVLTAAHNLQGKSGLPLSQIRVTGSIGVSFDPDLPTGVIRGLEVVNTGGGGVDAALLQLPVGGTYKYVQFCPDSINLPPGSKLYTLGFPLGQPLSINEGTLSAKQGPGGLWKTDIATGNGSDGAPLFDASGIVVGMIKGRLAGAPGNNFFLPSNLLSGVLSTAQAIWTGCNKSGTKGSVPDNGQMNSSPSRPPRATTDSNAEAVPRQSLKRITSPPTAESASDNEAAPQTLNSGPPCFLANVPGSSEEYWSSVARSRFPRFALWPPPATENLALMRQPKELQTLLSTLKAHNYEYRFFAIPDEKGMVLLTRPERIERSGTAVRESERFDLFPRDTQPDLYYRSFLFVLSDGPVTPTGEGSATSISDYWELFKRGAGEPPPNRRCVPKAGYSEWDAFHRTVLIYTPTRDYGGVAATVRDHLKKAGLDLIEPE